MLGVDNIRLSFTDGAIRTIAEIAVEDNTVKEDIGARRLHTIMESLLEDLSFNASGDHPEVDIQIDEKYVSEHLGNRVRQHDLKKYIL